MAALTIIIFWILTILIAKGSYVAFATSIIKQLAKMGYKFNIEKMKEETDLMPKSILKMNKLEMLIPIYNLAKTFLTINIFNKNREDIYNQFESLGLIEEIENYNKNDDTLTSFTKAYGTQKHINIKEVKNRYNLFAEKIELLSQDIINSGTNNNTMLVIKVSIMGSKVANAYGNLSKQNQITKADIDYVKSVIDDAIKQIDEMSNELKKSKSNGLEFEQPDDGLDPSIFISFEDDTAIEQGRSFKKSKK